MGTYPNAEAECISQGGRVEDRGGGCGASTAATPQGADTGRAASSALAAAAVAPIQALRNRLPDSSVLRDLAMVNFSPVILRLLSQDPEIRSRAADVVGMVGQFSLLVLVDPSSPTLTRSSYSEELHRWIIDLAYLIRERGEDEELRGAVDRLVDHFERQVGRPFSAIFEELHRNSTSAA